MWEIGSEFYTSSCAKGENKYFTLTTGQKEYILSGRTGLSYIADDLLAKYKIETIALPAYCCGSMVEPFASKNIKVIFYEINTFHQTIISADAVLLMDYFGFENSLTLQNAEFCKEKGIPIIVDATQTAFSCLKIYDLCDYLVCSYRKWTDCLCAAVYCRKGFTVAFSEQYEKEYAGLWRQAAEAKSKYLLTGEGNKEEFLGTFSKANEILGKKHNRLSAAPEEILSFREISSDFLRKRRRENAKFLLEKIKGELNGSVTPLFAQIQEADCPLFFPILLPEEHRTEIRKKLIKDRVYCPIHWPIDRNYPYMETILHHKELSLICDQRYNISDMQRQIDALKHAIHGVE